MNVQLDTDTARLVDRLAQLRAAIANHRLAGLIGNYPELEHVTDEAQPTSPLVTIRSAVQREIHRLEGVAKDCGL